MLSPAKQVVRCKAFGNCDAKHIAVCYQACEREYNNPKMKRYSKTSIMIEKN